MRNDDHLTDELLVMAIDDELPEPKAASAALHLSTCDECKQKYERLACLSSQLESLVAGVVINTSNDGRESLSQKLESSDLRIRTRRSPDKLLRRFGWGIAIAAVLAIGVILAPRAKNSSASNHPTLSASQSIGTFEVDGETFVPVPYSNSSLPLNAPHILQMRVPVSSLRAAGVSFEPISNEIARGDSSVLADVLLGIDGQPLGVHITGAE